VATLGNTPRPAYVYDTETDTWVPVGVGAHTHDYIPNTLVDAKGDILTATADNVPAKLTKGADGTVLVSDSTTQTGLAWQPYAAPNVSGKNLIINGAMEVWQRGTSFPSGVGLGAGVVYSADRWHWYRGLNESGATLTRQAAGLIGFRYCIRMQRNSGNSSAQALGLRYTAETADSLRFAGKQVTLSFWARKGADYTGSNSTYRATIATGTGTDQVVHSFTGFTYIVDQNVTLTTTWQRFSLTGNVGASATQIGLEMFYTPSGTAGTNDYLEITGIQVEEGPVATSFSNAAGSIQGELAACQRYYFRDVYGYIASGSASSTTVAKLNIPFPVTMRVTPHTFDYSGLGVQDGVNYYTNGTWGLAGNGSRTSGQVTYTHGAASLVQYRPYFLGWNDGNTYLGFSAEI